MSHPSHSVGQIHLSKNKKRKIIDSMAYFVGVFGNIAVLPQIIKAWQSDAPGLAVLTCIMFIFFGLIWLAYAIVHKQKPLIVAQIVSLSCNVAVVLGWFVNSIN
jgi:uncharacterized protein with PQ loop repeat